MIVWLRKIFHHHKWRPYRTFYPIRTWGSWGVEDGTAVFSKCDCGAKRKTEVLFKQEIIEGFVVEVKP